jgi:hypothetical protein
MPRHREPRSWIQKLDQDDRDILIPLLGVNWRSTPMLSTIKILLEYLRYYQRR